MTTDETTNLRPSEYSLWHRTLGEEFKAIDIDFVEWRADRGIVAIMGVTGRLKDKKHLINSMSMISERTRLERDIMITMSNALKVPAFLVVHTTDLSFFRVFELNSFGYKDYNKQEYGEWLKLI